MNCPACETDALKLTVLDDNLIASRCSKCGGHWIAAFQYWKWLKKHGNHLPEKLPTEGFDVPEDDANRASRFCPECESHLIRYPVGKSLHFSLDRCGNCAGIWFDKNEWEALKSRNLHDEIHMIFSIPWQSKIRKDEQKEHLIEQFKKKLGPQAFAKVQEFKLWLKEQENSRDIMIFLNDPEL